VFGEAALRRSDVEGPPMKRRLLIWVPILLVALAGVALALPSSPFYLPDLWLKGGHHDGHSTRYWIKQLESPDVKARTEAIHALGAIGADAEPAVPALADILTKDPEPVPRFEAAMALGKMRPASRSAVPALAAALTDKDLRVRMNAVIALAGLATESRPAIPALSKALEDETNETNLNVFSFTIREEAAIALGRASAGTPEAVAVLTETAKSSSVLPVLGASTVGLLGSPQGQGPFLAASALFPGRPSSSSPEALRQAAVRALGTVGPEARPAVPVLKSMLQDKGPVEPWVIKEALEKIEGKPAGAGRAAP
jgi:HEAT repeat protein